MQPGFPRQVGPAGAAVPGRGWGWRCGGCGWGLGAGRFRLLSVTRRETWSFSGQARQEGREEKMPQAGGCRGSEERQEFSCRSSDGQVKY